MAAKSSTEVLQDAYPGRVSLTPKEVAAALYGTDKASKKRVESVRQALDEGRLIPGLRKPGARWLVPIAALGAALDEQRRRAQASAHDIGPQPRRSKHSTIGPRMLLRVARSRQAWTEIWGALEHLRTQALGAHLDAALPPPAPDRPKPRRV